MANPPQHLPYRLQIERAELAEQLRVDMMRSDINLSRLRSWWQHAEALPNGLLFPQNKAQGYREVSTVWALAQIYMMISGTYQKTRQQTEAASKEAKIKADATMEGRNLLNPLVGLIAGGVMATGWYSTSPLLAALSAVMTSVGATTVLNLTTERILKSAEASTLDFKEDLSPKALPRWLPHILQQLRDIGLYPVFVVDELDKLKPQTELAAFIEQIKLLKGLLSESVFFCFVVDRGWFHEVEEEAHKGAPDGVFTLFTDRLFMSHMPSELRRYVEQLAHPDPGKPEPPEVWRRWSWILVHRARSTPHKLRDVLARYTDDEDPLYARLNVEEWPMKGELLIQVAVEHLAEHGTLYAQLREHPSWLQLALDVLYLPSALWAQNQPVVIEKEFVIEQLHARSILVAGEDPLLPLLLSRLRELCEILVNPKTICDSPSEAKLLENAEPLLKPLSENRYEWTYPWLPT
jgi:hypothetical protein